MSRAAAALAAGALASKFQVKSTAPTHWLHAPLVGDYGRLGLTGSNVDSALSESGNGNSITKISDARRPTITLSNTLDGHTEFVFQPANDAALRNTLQGLATPSSPSSQIQIAKFPALTAGANQIAWFMSFGNGTGAITRSIGQQWTSGNVNSVLLGCGGTGQIKPRGASPSFLNQTSFYMHEQHYDGTNIFCLENGVIPSDPYSTSIAGQCESFFQPGTSVDVPNTEYGYQRGAPGFGIQETRLHDGLFYASRMISYLEILKLQKYFIALYPTAFPSVLKDLLIPGDSIAAGFTLATPATQRYGALFAAARGYRERNCGKNSVTINAITVPNPQSMTSQKGPIALFAGFGKAPDIVYEGGINDFSQNRTGAQVYADDTALCAYWRSVRPGCRIIRLTVTPDTGQTGAQNTQRQNANTLIRADASKNYDFVVDLDATPLATVTGTYYTDNVHYNAAGHALVSAALVSTVPA